VSPRVSKLGRIDLILKHEQTDFKKIYTWPEEWKLQTAI
jgi:hypothetical protein